MVPSMLNSITACDLPIAAIWPGEIGSLELLLGDVGGVLDDLEGLAVLIEDRVVGGLDPDLLAALADPLVLGRLVFAAVQRSPRSLGSRRCPA